MIEKYHSPNFSKKVGRPSVDPGSLRLARKKLNHVESVLSVLAKEMQEGKDICNDCNVGLCAVPCFKIYHTKLHF